MSHDIDVEFYLPTVVGNFRGISATVSRVGWVSLRWSLREPPKASPVGSRSDLLCSSATLSPIPVIQSDVNARDVPVRWTVAIACPISSR
ncbi:MAG TPA: hypothetical protein V6D43_23350 [Candidatus Sericytochromatia bacterium]